LENSQTRLNKTPTQTARTLKFLGNSLLVELRSIWQLFL